MSLYGAIDLSMKESHVCLLGTDRSIVFEASVESTPEAIDLGLREAGYVPTGIQQIVIESGRMVPYIYHGLRGLGWPIQAIDSVHAHALLKTKRLHKTDKNDARGLAEFAVVGAHQPVHIKSIEAHRIRSLMCARDKLMASRVGIENSIRSLCVNFGIKVGSKAGKAFDAAVQDAFAIDELKLSVGALIEARREIQTQIAVLTKRIGEIAKENCVTRRLMEIPGVGPMTAVCFMATLDEPERFKKARDVGAFLGLVPKRHQSGTVDYSSGITKRGDSRLKRLLYEAANSILVRSKTDSSLKRWASQLASRKGLKKARIALARKLCIVMQAMAMDGTFFEPFPSHNR